ncbi:MAG: hypothetical protein IJO91_08080 [Oscillospiraceae bacterium]|nr:hypothetical protein [Oscillospiraceae bacterium]
MKRIFKRMLCAAVAATMLLCSATAYAEPAGAAPEADAPVSEQVQELPVTGESRVYLRDGMRAVVLTPTVDFCAEGDTSDAAMAEEMSVLTAQLAEYGMNTVLINTDYTNKESGEVTPFYDLELNQGTTVLGTAIESFRNVGMTVFAVLDVNALIQRLSEQGIGIKNGFSAAVHKFAMKYACDGILLTNYYTSDTPAMFEEYM